MNNSYLKKLEYEKILNILSSFCTTYIGKKLSLELTPSNKKEEVQILLAQTNEAVSLINRISLPPISEIENIEVFIKLLESASCLSCKAILSIKHILEISNNLISYFSVFSKTDEYPNLSIYFNKLYTNHNIINKIETVIIDENTISDTATSTLASIRRKILNTEQNIKNKLNTIIHSSSYSKYIQENIVTIRNNRYVVPIKQEFKSEIKGFIHDISSTGSTVFIEPISIFELNNELNNLKIGESTEIEKILFSLSSMLFPYTEELKNDISLIGKLDFIFGKAKYSNSLNAVSPIINNTKQINLIKAKHPLIDKDKVVPININIGNDYSMLIITGPNTGGKTVTLKTVGLLELMACSGLNIPCKENSSIFVFDEIFADIGDDQSIAESLSTFSSHIVNISYIVNNSTENSLILVDELGSGTDPVEGASLAISILEFFKEKNCLTIATTHFQELKKYAITTKNVQNASVEFDVENLKPTYKLIIGIPGKSNAFEVSRKLGLNEDIIQKATSLLDKKDIDFESLLKQIYNNKIQIEKEKEEIDKNLAQIELLRKNLQKDNLNVKQKEIDLINNAKTEARNILLDAKEKASKLINQIKEIENSSNSINILNNLRNEITESIKSISTDINTENFSSKPIQAELIKPNLKVYITNLKQNGIVISNINKNNEVQVQIGLIKTSININYLEPAKKLQNDLTVSPLKSNNRILKTKNISSEINVIGLNVEEAIPIVDKFIDDCILAKLDTARIVHGKGTGKLRSGIHSFLKKHPKIESFRVGTYGEGEMGVTIITIKS